LATPALVLMVTLPTKPTQTTTSAIPSNAAAVLLRPQTSHPITLEFEAYHQRDEEVNRRTLLKSAKTLVPSLGYRYHEPIESTAMGS